MGPGKITNVETNSVCGTAAEKFWIADNSNTRANLIERNLWEAGSMRFAPVGGERALFVTGEAGVFRVVDSDSDDNLNDEQWCASVRGLAATSNKSVDVHDDGVGADWVIVGNIDYRALSADDGLTGAAGAIETVRPYPTIPAGTSRPSGGYDTAFDIETNTAYFASGYRDVKGRPEALLPGPIEFVWPNPQSWVATNPDSPSALGLVSGSSPGESNRGIGIAAATNTGTTPQFVLAASQGQGVWLGEWNAGTMSFDWTQQLTPGDLHPYFVMDQVSDYDRAPMEWARNATGYVGVAYVLDRDSGLWRGRNLFGATPNWQRIWPAALSEAALDSHFPPDDPLSEFIGHLAVHPTNPDRLFISTNTEVLEFENARTCNVGTCTVSAIPAGGAGQLPSDLAPGPIAYTPGDECLLIAGRVQTASDLAELWRINEWGNNPTEIIGHYDPVTENSAEALHFTNGALLLTDMAAGAENGGTAYLTSKGYGITEVQGVGGC